MFDAIPDFKSLIFIAFSAYAGVWVGNYLLRAANLSQYQA